MAGMDSGTDNNFWPGYVDAISNLVLNLLFVVAILTIAVFLFAIELGRKQVSHAGAANKKESIIVKSAESGDRLPIEKERLELEVSNLRKELIRLQAAASALVANGKDQQKAAKGSHDGKDDKEAALCAPAPAVAERSESSPQSAAQGGSDSRLSPKRVDASEKTAVPAKELDGIYRGGPIVVDFSADSVTLTKAEAEEARRALGPVAASGGARLEVVVHGSFTEARRLAFYRTMAVRNLLIEMGLPLGKIDVSIREVKTGGDSTKVLVRGLK